MVLRIGTLTELPAVHGSAMLNNSAAATNVPRRALESFCLCCCDWGWLCPRWLPPRLDVLLFALGVAAITHCYSDSNGVHRDVFRCVCLGELVITRRLCSV